MSALASNNVFIKIHPATMKLLSKTNSILIFFSLIACATTGEIGDPCSTNIAQKGIRQQNEYALSIHQTINIYRDPSCPSFLCLHKTASINYCTETCHFIAPQDNTVIQCQSSLECMNRKSCHAGSCVYDTCPTEYRCQSIDSSTNICTLR